MAFPLLSAPSIHPAPLPVASGPATGALVPPMLRDGLLCLLPMDGTSCDVLETFALDADLLGPRASSPPATSSQSAVRTLELHTA